MRMNSTSILSLALAASIGAVAGAQASDFSADAEATLGSHYVWRGFDVLDGVQLPLQPSVTVGHTSGLSVNVWGSWALLDRDNTKAGDEIDYTIDYSTDVTDALSISAGFIYYSFPEASAAKTSEIYAGASYAAVGSPSLTVYYDSKLLDDGANEADGIYVSLAGAHTLPVAGLDVDLGGSLGYGSSDAFDGLQDLNLSASTSMPVGPISISPFVAATFILEDLVNDDSVVIYGGATCSYSF